MMTRTGSFVISRGALLAATSGDTDGMAGPVAEARAVVVADNNRTSIMLAGPGDLRRIDLWVGPTGLVLHGFDDDESAEVPGSFHDGRGDAVLALSQLAAQHLGRSERWAPDDDQLGSTTGDLRTLLSASVQGTSGAEDAFSVVVLTSPLSTGGLKQIVAAKRSILRWSEVGADESIDLRSGGLATLWSHFLGVLDPIEIAAAATPP